MPRKVKAEMPFELELLPVGTDFTSWKLPWQIGGDYTSPGEAESALITRVESEHGWAAARIRQYGPTPTNRATAKVFGKFLINGDQIKKVG